VNVAAGAAVTFADTQHLAGLNIAAGGNAAVTGTGLLLQTGGLTIAGNGKLDLGRNELLAAATPSAIEAMLFAGQLRSSSAGGALGYADAGGGWTDVQFTVIGDTNLDDVVDVRDLGNLAGAYGTAAGALWVQGDTNYDGAVDVTDLGNLASNYGASLSFGAM